MISLVSYTAISTTATEQGISKLVECLPRWLETSSELERTIAARILAEHLKPGVIYITAIATLRVHIQTQQTQHCRKADSKSKFHQYFTEKYCYSSVSGSHIFYFIYSRPKGNSVMLVVPQPLLLLGDSDLRAQHCELSMGVYCREGALFAKGPATSSLEVVRGMLRS